MTILGATWFAALMGLSPVKASIVGAQLAGWPGMASEVIDICEDESLCEPIGIHRGPLDRVDGGTVWKRAVESAGACEVSTATSGRMQSMTLGSVSPPKRSTCRSSRRSQRPEGWGGWSRATGSARHRLALTHGDTGLDASATSPLSCSLW